jgi:hypothetical protein
VLSLSGERAPAQEDEWGAAPPAWEGSWKGTVGSLPVHVCLNSTPYEKRGAYYYDRHKVLISLELDQQRQEWVEGHGRTNKGPRWKLAPNAGQLTGTWTSGTKILPVRLTRMGGPSQGYEGPCAKIEFQRARLSTVRVTRRKGAKDGATFTTWSFKPGSPYEDGSISTFTLDRGDGGVPRVNALLRDILPKPDGSGMWLECMAGNANAHGTDGEYLESIEPVLISRRWLSARHHNDNYCGGNHPNTSNRWRTFDLATGVEVNAHEWFKPSAVKVTRYAGDDEPVRTLTGDFRAAILAGWKPADRDCQDAIAGQEFWNVGIVRGSMVFSPDLPRVMMACGEEFRVPFAKLQPWLNEAGQAAVATLPR